MSKIAVGQKAPTFTLQGTDGRTCALEDALARGPVVLAFFKISCPVCQFTFPFLQRLYERYGKDGATFWGVSQDNPRDTKEFASEYGLTFPMLVDSNGYTVSNLYGLTNVPTYYLIDSDGAVKISSVGFGKAELENIAAELAARKKEKPQPVFLPTEVVPAYKPG